jgi:ATP-dependent Clp protease ATP-binding subunit ClpC
MLLPFQFLKFWFVTFPSELATFFVSLNNAFLELSSLHLLLKTYFKPWKNEYREGLVKFSIGMGIFVKTFIILADLILFFVILIIEFFVFFSFILLPFFAIFSFFQSFPYKNYFSLISLVLVLIIFLLSKPKKKFSEIIASKKQVIDVIKFLLEKEEIKFLLEKAGIKKEEIGFVEIQKNTTADNSLDFFADYLLLTETQTKLLFRKKLKKEDLLNIVYWSKVEFPIEEKPHVVTFFGEGFMDSCTYGWTLETKKYMVDLTPEVLSRKPLLFGRQSEYKQLFSALTARKSVILVGEPGSGKNSLVEALSFESFSSHLKDFHHQRIFKLYVDTLLAGATNQGEIEKRLDEIIAEISHSGNVVIYITDFENILGSSSFKIDLSGVLIPYLKSKKIRIIGAVTKGSYKKFIERLASLADVFEIIKLEEPDRNTVLQMLLNKASFIERKMKVRLSYRAILSALDLANKYLIDRVLPGAGVVLLEDTANEVYLSGRKEVLEEDVVKRVEEKTKTTLSPPTAEEKKLLVNLEDKIHESLIDQEEAVKSIAEAMRRIRSGIKFGAKPISFLFLGPTGVGKTQTAKTLANLYFNGEKNMIRFDMSEYSTNNSIGKFIGSSVGSEDEGIAGKVHGNPSSLILLDEFEKADPSIHNLFLQILDDGRLTDNNGKTVSFANAIVVATSNAGSEFIREELARGSIIDKNFKDKFLGHLLSGNIFTPELLNRFDDIVVFKPLGSNEVIQVIGLLLKEIVGEFSKKDISVNFDDKIIAKIAKEGFHEQFGARPLRRFIQDNLEDVLAKKILKDEIKRGDKVNISVDSSNSIQLIICS